MICIANLKLNVKINCVKYENLLVNLKDRLFYFNVLDHFVFTIVLRHNKYNRSEM